MTTINSEVFLRKHFSFQSEKVLSSQHHYTCKLSDPMILFLALHFGPDSCRSSFPDVLQKVFPNFSKGVNATIAIFSQG